MTHWICTCPDGPRITRPHEDTCSFAGMTPVPLADVREAAHRGYYFHTDAVTTKAESLGFKVRSWGLPPGISEAQMLEMMTELENHRADRERLREWLTQYTSVYKTTSLTDPNPVTLAIRIMNDTRTVITAAWPHLVTMYTNIAHVLRNAGVIP